MKTDIRLPFAFTLLLPLISAATAAADVQVPRVQFLDPQFKQFDPGDRVVIRVRAQDLAGAGPLRVRVFPGDPQELRQKYFTRNPDGCLLYNSVVFDDVVDNAGFIDFRGRINAGWLRTEGGKLVNSKYLLVIERNGFTGKWVKIFDRSFDEYFGRGYIFELVAPVEREPSVIERVVTAIVDAVTPDTAYAAPPVETVRTTPPPRAAAAPTAARPPMTMRAAPAVTSSPAPAATDDDASEPTPAPAPPPARRPAAPPPSADCIVLRSQ